MVCVIYFSANTNASKLIVCINSMGARDISIFIHYYKKAVVIFMGLLLKKHFSITLMWILTLISLINDAISHSFGYDCGRRANLKLLDDRTLIFIAGNMLVLLDVNTKEQRYLRSCSGGGIGAITVRGNYSSCKGTVPRNLQSLWRTAGTLRS